MQVETEDKILFWRSDSVFSNWYSLDYTETCRIYEDDHTFHFLNSEAAFMWLKANFFEDIAIANEILVNQTPKKAKGLGRRIKPFDEGMWSLVREGFMHQAVYAKFSGTERLKKLLLDTGSKTLVEASPVDTIWGIGLAPDDPLALDGKNWKGLNLLGKILMRVRDQLRKEALEELVASSQEQGLYD